MENIYGVPTDDYSSPTFSINLYDKEGNAYCEGFYLHYGDMIIKVASSLRGFKAHARHLVFMADEIAESEDTMEALPQDLENIGDIMSNFNHEIEHGAEARLKNEKVCGNYAGWNFHGKIWFDGMFKCQVKRYRVHVATIVGETLQEIMDNVSSEFGYD